jgi:hypothetical protein
MIIFIMKAANSAQSFSSESAKGLPGGAKDGQALGIKGDILFGTRLYFLLSHGSHPDDGAERQHGF